MNDLHNLRVFNEARVNVLSIARLCDQTRRFGDIQNQAKRAAVSVVSNIAEGNNYGSLAQNRKFFKIARASNNELYAQALIIGDLNPQVNIDDLTENINYVGRMLTRLIKNSR